MKIVMRPDPDFLDLAAWRQRLAELRADSLDVAGRDVSIAHAETMVELLEQDPENSAAEAL